tara:strand:+ start:3997 stop:4509 length:513 start_codon:yes stop_codon:yes gene_type:complete
MDLKPLSYNGRDEGIEVTLRSELRPGDDSKNVAIAIHSLFPDAVIDAFEREIFPSDRQTEIVCNHLSFERFLEQLRTQVILDTAMDAMGQHLNENQTVFRISRLAAFAGKIAFVNDDLPLGGSFEILLQGVGLSDWIEACTWHSGRQNVPRQLHDESAMDESGEASTWHQ